MGIFERYLSVWVGLSIITGIFLGHVTPDVFGLFSELTFANVNIAVAILIWVMIYPMMIQVDFSSIKDLTKKPQGLILTLIINWLIKPFTMAALGWLFFKIIFADVVDPVNASEYIAGMILLGVAPCTAMVFVWSQLTKGDANYTLVQVSVNDIIMVFAFAPLAALLLGVTNVVVPWNTLILSVILYVLIPLIAGILTRSLYRKNTDSLNQLLTRLKPWSIVGLLATVVLLFGFQAETILSQPFGNTFIDSNLWNIRHQLFGCTFFEIAT